MRVFEIAAIGQTQQKGVSISKDQQEQKKSLNPEFHN